MARLSAELISPRANQTVVAGQSLAILVRAAEESGELSGAGYVLRRFGPTPFTIDSAALHFATVRDTTVGFTTGVPDSLPNNAQLEVSALAFAAGGSQLRSAPRAVLVVHCTPAAAWCR